MDIRKFVEGLDDFIAENGYLTIYETARRWGCSEGAIRIMLSKNQITPDDYICVNGKYYIVETLKKPTGKPRGRYARPENRKK